MPASDNDHRIMVTGLTFFGSVVFNSAHFFPPRMPLIPHLGRARLPTVLKVFPERIGIALPIIWLHPITCRAAGISFTTARRAFCDRTFLICRRSVASLMRLGRSVASPHQL